MTAEPVRRLFFALWPPPDVARQLHEAARLAQRNCGGRLMRRETLHVTLAFLGALPASRLADAEAAAAAVSGEAFALDIDRLGYWKHNRILWAGCTASPEALNRLADGLAQALRAAGFQLDARPFAVHATLLRKAHCPTAAPMPAAPIRWPVTDFALVESRSSPDGSRYEPLRRWALAASAH